LCTREVGKETLNKLIDFVLSDNAARLGALEMGKMPFKNSVVRAKAAKTQKQPHKKPGAQLLNKPVRISDYEME